MPKNDQLMTATEYAAEKGKSKSWGTRLAQRAIEDGKEHPQRIGHYWMATFEQWEQVLNTSGFELRNRTSYRKDT